jgi:hypothetical protein
MMSLQAQMDHLAQQQKAIGADREDSIRRQRALVMQYNIETSFDAKILEASGKTSQAQLIAMLQELSDSRAADALALDESLTALDAELAKILAQVPSTAKQVSAVQASFGSLGMQRSSKESVALLQGYAKDIKKDMVTAGAAATAALAAASAAASPAPVQAAPTPKKSP